METYQIIVLSFLVALLLEVSYLVIKLPRQSAGRQQYMFLDTSVLIDGRIVSIIESGFVAGTIAIPRSVIGELQYMADNADAEKRLRARHGLDVARSIQDISNADVVLFQDGTKTKDGVDNQLIALAKKFRGSICTIDYNLNKVAAVEGITVCNVNELAKNLRMAYLPGEKTSLELVQKGQDSHQAVGYLSDGTMVVVENASGQIGNKVEVEFIRSLQTAAGKMMFARRLTESASNQNVGVSRRKHVSSQAEKARKRSPKQALQKYQKKSTISSEDKLLDLVDRQS